MEAHRVLNKVANWSLFCGVVLTAMAYVLWKHSKGPPLTPLTEAFMFVGSAAFFAGGMAALICLVLSVHRWMKEQNDRA